MHSSLPRRTLLASSGAVGAAALLIPAAARSEPGKGGKGYGGGGSSASVTLIAQVLDGGEQVTSLTISSSALSPVRRSSLSTSTFAVHVRATNPVSGEIAYEQDRVVTDASWSRRGEVVLGLEHGEGVSGGATLAYMFAQARNVLLELDYTITQVQPLAKEGKSGKEVTLTSFVQGDLVDAEVDAFSSGVTASGLNYRLFTPSGGRGRKRPLIVWLHGGGEGGLITDEVDYYDNEAPLRANRGALGFATEHAQEVFGGAYVLAPQSTSAWMADGDGFAPLIREAIGEVVADASVDVDRIHVVGCSNGGYMSLKMVAEYPETFASSVPICCGIGPRDGSGGYYISDEELMAMATPTWLVASADDTTLPPEDNTIPAHALIPDSIMSLYDDVTWDGTSFPGHWSWIYVAHDDPQHEGVRIWEWMAQQEL